MAVTIITKPTEDGTYYADEELYVVLESDRFASGEPNVDNLRAYLELYNKTADPDELLVTLQAPYDYSTQQTSFNLGCLAPVLKTLPSTASIKGAPLISGQISNSIMEMYFKYGDKFGSPPTPETLLTSTDFFVIKGSRSAENDRGDMLPVEPTAPFVLLHSADFVKVITVDQPDWLYFYAQESLTLDIDIKLLFEDGSDSTVDLSQIVALANTGYWFQAGLDQLNIDQAGLYAYTIIMKKVGESSTREITYQIDRTCQDFGFTLLFDNGLGGMETIQFKGKTEVRYETSRNSYRKFRSSSFSTADGEIGIEQGEGNKILVARTGYYTRAEIEHLAQLIHGEAWRVNTDNATFESYVVLSNRLTLSEDDADLYALEVELMPGWVNENATRLTIGFV